MMSKNKPLHGKHKDLQMSILIISMKSNKPYNGLISGFSGSGCSAVGGSG